MTYLDVLFRYATLTVRACDARHGCGARSYGICRIEFNERDLTVRVEFDASRLSDERGG